MAVYNAEQWLHKSIASVLSQTYSNWELLCMDDGSVDNSLSILHEYARMDNRIRVYSYKHTGSHSVMVNNAIQLSGGEFVTTIDSDDYVSTDFLELTIKRVLETDADLCVSNMYRVNVAGEFLSSLEGVNGNTEIEINSKEAVVYSLDWSISALGIWRKNIFINIPADETGFSIEYTTRQRLLACNKVVFSRGIYYYVQHDKAITKRLGPRRFYYVVLDVKILQLLRDNKFDKDILSNYYYDSIKRLINCCCLFYRSRRNLSHNDRRLVYDYLLLSYSFLFNQVDLISNTLHRFSKKQQLLLRHKSRIIFLLYCYLRSI